MKSIKKTKNSNLNFASKSSNSIDRKWLAEIRDQRKMRSTEIGMKAIDSLLKEKKRVSYRSVALRSKEIDPEGKGIHANTIKTNDSLYQYYNEHCNVKKSSSNSIDIVLPDGTYFRNIKLERDVESVKKRYAKLSKTELIMLLVNAEQHIAAQNKRWLKEQFEHFN